MNAYSLTSLELVFFLSLNETSSESLPVILTNWFSRYGDWTFLFTYTYPWSPRKADLPKWKPLTQEKKSHDNTNPKEQRFNAFQIRNLPLSIKALPIADCVTISVQPSTALKGARGSQLSPPRAWGTPAPWLHLFPRTWRSRTISSPSSNQVSVPISGRSAIVLRFSNFWHHTDTKLKHYNMGCLVFQRHYVKALQTSKNRVAPSYSSTVVC